MGREEELGGHILKVRSLSKLTRTFFALSCVLKDLVKRLINEDKNFTDLSDLIITRSIFLVIQLGFGVGQRELVPCPQLRSKQGLEI